MLRLVTNVKLFSFLCTKLFIHSAKVAVSPFIVYKGRYGTLNLVDCEVTVIDDISSVDDSLFHRGPICTLYLSNNLISSLDGIEQEVFRTITKLSLSNNDIRRVNDLLPLSKLPKLITLSLNGNPVTHLPYYKQEVLTICVRNYILLIITFLKLLLPLKRDRLDLEVLTESISILLQTFSSLNLVFLSTEIGEIPLQKLKLKSTY